MEISSFQKLFAAFCITRHSKQTSCKSRHLPHSLSCHPWSPRWCSVYDRRSVDAQWRDPTRGGAAVTFNEVVEPDDRHVAPTWAGLPIARSSASLTSMTMCWRTSKYELIEAQQLAIDEDGHILVWTGNRAAPRPCSTLDGSSGIPWPTHSPFAYTPSHLAEKILTSRSALEGERKQVTVLFADLKGSMELIRRPRSGRRPPAPRSGPGAT